MRDNGMPKKNTKLKDGKQKIDTAHHSSTIDKKRLTIEQRVDTLLHSHSAIRHPRPRFSTLQPKSKFFFVRHKPKTKTLTPLHSIPKEPQPDPYEHHTSLFSIAHKPKTKDTTLSSPQSPPPAHKHKFLLAKYKPTIKHTTPPSYSKDLQPRASAHKLKLFSIERKPKTRNTTTFPPKPRPRSPLRQYKFFQISHKPIIKHPTTPPSYSKDPRPTTTVHKPKFFSTIHKLKESDTPPPSLPLEPQPQPPGHQHKFFSLIHKPKTTDAHVQPTPSEQPPTKFTPSRSKTKFFFTKHNRKPTNTTPQASEAKPLKSTAHQSKSFYKRKPRTKKTPVPPSFTTPQHVTPIVHQTKTKHFNLKTSKTRKSPPSFTTFDSSQSNQTALPSKYFFVKQKEKTKETTNTPKPKHPTKDTPSQTPLAGNLGASEEKELNESIHRFPEYLPDVNPEEASWIDQKVKENIDPDSKKPAPLTAQALDLRPHQKPQPTPEPSPNSTEFTSSPAEPAKKARRFGDLAPDGEVQYQALAQDLKNQTLNQLGYIKGNIEEIDFYPLLEPYAYVQIIREQDTLDKRYLLVEVQLDENENQLLNFMKTTFSTVPFHTSEIEDIGGKEYLTRKVDEILGDYMISISNEEKEKLIYFLEKEFLGLGKLEILMRDANIEDISCDGVSIPIFLYHRRFGSLQSNVQFTEEEQLSAFVVKLAQKCGKHISVAEPMLDATMPDGSRIQMTLSTEVTTKGSTFTIRKFSEDPFSPPDLVEFHTMSSEMVAFMWLAIENNINALIAGGTAAGKTSTLNALSLFIPREAKIVSIEETREINLPHPNWIPGVVRSGFGEVVGNKVVGEIDLYDLMKAALRQRPEYIIVGEIRGKEAYVLFQAMATGHTTYSTVHADSAQSLIHRLEGKPIEIPRIMLQALDLICIQIISRVKNKRARRCKQIIEIIDIDPTTKEILTNEVFHWDPIEDKFNYSGKSYILERIRAEKDITREEMIQEIKNRALLIEWMNKENYREFKKVATIIAQYSDNPTDIMKKVLGQA